MITLSSSPAAAVNVKQGVIDAAIELDNRWQYARLIVSGLTEIPFVDSAGNPLTSETIEIMAASEDETGHIRIKFNPADLATETVIVSGSGADRLNGLIWKPAGSLRANTSSSSGRGVIVYRYK
jgi:hypothetical protein